MWVLDKQGLIITVCPKTYRVMEMEKYTDENMNRE